MGDDNSCGLLFPTSNHVRDDESKTMATKRHENTGLIKYPPHFIRQLFLHMLPLFGTWIIVKILCKI